MNALGLRIIHFADQFLREGPTPIGEFLWPLVPALPCYLQLRVVELIGANVFKSFPKYGLERMPRYRFPMELWARKENVLAVSVSFRTATCKQSVSVQCPIFAEPSMLEKISSSEMADSAPDHFGTKETKDRSLWTVGGLCLTSPLSAGFPTALRSIRALDGPLGSS